MRFIYIVTICTSISVCQGGLFSFLFSGSKKKEQVREENTSSNSDGENSLPSSDVALRANVPFEVRSSDDKFLAEASAYTSIALSELDVCHHKVILALHSSCSDMTEEDLAKVSVNLLNCQSSVEGRKVYPCTQDMALSECTQNMDPTTWNAYHIVSNRARAVCYASRQEQFRAKSEMTVNKLMRSAHDQIENMNDLKAGQMALEEATSETLESLSKGHDHLRSQQQQLAHANQAVHGYVSSNLRDLTKEKRLIASGQRELAQMTEAIKKKLDMARKQLNNQEDSQRDAHKQILNDLATIQDNALKVWTKLDGSTMKILKAHEETVEQYGRLTDDLQRMNATVHHLMDMLQATREGVENKLSWITNLIGGTENTVQKLYSCVLHIGYFFIGMLAASFLQVPYATRLALVILVPLNAMSEVKHDSSLQFSTLTLILGICILVNLCFSLLMSLYRWKKSPEYLKSGSAVQPIIYEYLQSPQAMMNGSFKPDTPTQNSPPKHRIYNSSPHIPASSIKKEARISDDYSSDDEPDSLPKITVSGTSLFTRMSTLSVVKGSDKQDDYEDSKVATLSPHSKLNDTTNLLEEMDKVKQLTNVKRHLMNSLNTNLPSKFNQTLEPEMLESPNRRTPMPSRSGTPKGSITLTPKKLCTGICKNGQLCRNAAPLDFNYCHRHAEGSRAATPRRRSVNPSREASPLMESKPRRRSVNPSRDASPLRNAIFNEL